MTDHLADAAVGIIGLGYVGSPLAVGPPLVVGFAGAGLRVVGYDLSADPGATGRVSMCGGTTGRVPAYVDVL